MSWLDLINTDYTITLGKKSTSDSAPDANGGITRTTQQAQYSVKWLNAAKQSTYNIAEFNFKAVDGTLVKRGTPRGVKYNIEIYFDGADHLDTATKFLADSDYSDDNGIAPPWEIAHPYYGTLFVQPSSLVFDNSQHNVTKITGEVLETIMDNGRAYAVSPPDVIKSQAVITKRQIVDTYSSGVPSMKVSDLQQLANNINNTYNSTSALLNGYQADVNKYAQYFYAANAVLNTAIYDTNDILQQADNLISAPEQFTDTLVRRLNMLSLQLETYAELVAPLLLSTNPVYSLKKLYENNAAITIAAMCVATTVNITTDFNYRPDVLRVIQTIVTNYNAYIENLYALQSANGGFVGAYIPDPTAITSLYTLVNLTTSYLLGVSAGAKQQRTTTLIYDADLLNTVNDIYGLVLDDSTIQTFIANNNIQLSELLILKAGRQIIYYV